MTMLAVPLHLDPNDASADANLARIALFQHMFSLTGGRGFRAHSPRIEAMGNASFADDTPQIERKTSARKFKRRIGWVRIS